MEILMSRTTLYLNTVLEEIVSINLIIIKVQILKQRIVFVSD